MFLGRQTDECVHPRPGTVRLSLVQPSPHDEWLSWWRLTGSVIKALYNWTGQNQTTGSTALVADWWDTGKDGGRHKKMDRWRATEVINDLNVGQGNIKKMPSTSNPFYWLHQSVTAGSHWDNQSYQKFQLRPFKFIHSPTSNKDNNEARYWCRPESMGQTADSFLSPGFIDTYDKLGNFWND